MQESFYSMDNSNGNNNIALDRTNNQNSYHPQSQQPHHGQQIDVNTLAAMIQQQQQQMQMQPQQMMQMQPQRNMNSSEQQAGVNISNEIKRLQQLHQMNSAGVSGNALLMQGGQRNPNDTSLLQSMLDQKTHNPRFDTSLSQGMMNGGINQILQPGLFQDARLIMAQNQFSGQNNMNQGLMQQSDIPSSSRQSHFLSDTSRRMRGGVIEPFPEKLHRLLLEVEAAGMSDIISFIADGRAFAIHKPDTFFNEVVNVYFRQKRLSSFKRQLNLYGFELINAGPARGGYYHELFKKDSPELCRRMRRVAVKVSSKEDRRDDTVNPPGEVPVPGAVNDEPLR